MRRQRTVVEFGPGWRAVALQRSTATLLLLLCCCTAGGVPFLKSIQHLLRSEELFRHKADTPDAEADRVTQLPGWGKVADRVYSG